MSKTLDNLVIRLENPVRFRQPQSPGRFEVWEASRRQPTLESVFNTATDAINACRSLHAEYGSRFVAIDTHQVDRQAQKYYDTATKV